MSLKEEASDISDRYKTIGILGGMGPAATYDLGMKIIENTKASCDQEHIPVIVDCNARIPDRTAAMLRGGADPLPEMTKSAKRLEAAGADFLIMPCNTAHYFYDGVREAVSIPILHMPRETAARLKERGVRRAGVLASDGTCRAGIYNRALEEAGIEAVYPSEGNQKVIMSLIYDCVKAGNMDFSALDIDGVISEMKAQGAEILILGCTELPIAFDVMNRSSADANASRALPTIDPTNELARAAVTAAGAELCI